MEDYLKWEIGSEVSAEDRRIAMDAAELMHGYAVSLGLPEIPQHSTFYLFHNLDALAAAYEKGTGRTLEKGGAGRNFAEGKSLAVAGRGWIVLNTSFSQYQSYPSERNTKVIAHELFHTYQHTLSSLPVGGPPDRVPTSGPRWLSEGSAEFLAFQALSEGGIFPYDTARQRIFMDSVKSVDRPLKDMETWAGFSATGGRSYRFTPLAIELLAAHAGRSALIDYYTLLRPGSTWQEAFQTAFGMTVDQFYQRFEAHRSAGFPELEISD